jgi:hypothetical protein
VKTKDFFRRPEGRKVQSTSNRQVPFRTTVSCPLFFELGLLKGPFGASPAFVKYLPTGTASGLAIVLSVIPFAWIIVADNIAPSHDLTTIHYGNHGTMPEEA